MILSDRGIDRRIQEMGLGNNMIQGIFSWKGNEGWTQSSEIMTFFPFFCLILGSRKSIISILT